MISTAVDGLVEEDAAETVLCIIESIFAVVNRIIGCKKVIVLLYTLCID